MNARRRLKRQKRQVEDVAVQADDSLEKHFFKRIGRLYQVRRFVFSWTVLLLFIGFGSIWQVRGLNSFYLDLSPVSGGIYREGIVGSFTTANPIFAVDSVDVSVSKLVFSALFKINPDGELESDLATNYSIDEDGLLYTVKLKDNVYWHDGQKLTAADVVYTYNIIKNPETKSPLFSGWSPVDVKALDDFTVTFTLPNVLGSFPLSLTNGILPQHVLKDVAAADLRSSSFNAVNPIGTGPFRYKTVEVIEDGINDRTEKITLEKNINYFQTEAKIDGVVIKTYKNEDLIQKAFIDKEISSIVGLQSVSDEVLKDETVQTFSTPMKSSVMLFLNNSSPILSDTKVRTALLRATDKSKLVDSIGYQLIEADSPFIKSQFTYDGSKIQAGLDLNEANRLLDEAGWIREAGGTRKKNGQELKLRLISQSLTEYSTIVQGIQSQWSAAGVGVDAVLQPEEELQSGAIAHHDYDVLLYGISLGPDPDIFAYWHSSQTDPRLKSRLNLSEYKSAVADRALEGGRTRLDESLRKVKYAPFVDAWLADTPAIALYQPRFLFVVRGIIDGYQSGEFSSPVDRFYSITDWKIRRDRVIK